MAFSACGNNLKSTFITEAEIIDRCVGNQLWSWGKGVNGMNAENIGAINRSVPVQTITGGVNWVQLAVSTQVKAAIKQDGTLWLWGNNSCGQLGDNNVTGGNLAASSPVQTVAGGTNWKCVSVGANTVGAIKTDGTLWMWGANFNIFGGVLGNGSTLPASSPVQTVAGGTNWKQVSVGPDMAAGAIKTDGTLWMWGKMVVNGTNNAASSPVQTVAGGNNWKALSVGTGIASAIKTDGTLWLWGNNDGGQFGIGTTSPQQVSAVQTIAGGTNWKCVSAGQQSVGAIKTDGTLWVWGCGQQGQLANGSTTSVSSPVQTIAGGTTWKSVCMAQWNGAAIKTDGTLWTWGDGQCGQLGNGFAAYGSSANKSSPVQTVAGGNNWKQVAIDVFTAGGITFTS